MTVTRKPLDYLQNTFFGKISRSEWVKKASVCSRLFPSLQCNRHLYEMCITSNIGCIRLGNLDLDFEIRISPTRNPSSGWISITDFMDFLFTVRLGNTNKDLQNYSHEQHSSFCDYPCACKTAVLRDSFFKSFFRFPNHMEQRKSKNRYLSIEIHFRISRLIANLKSRF